MGVKQSDSGMRQARDIYSHKEVQNYAKSITNLKSNINYTLTRYFIFVAVICSQKLLVPKHLFSICQIYQIFILRSLIFLYFNMPQSDKATILPSD